jgi:hypothetical protein
MGDYGRGEGGPDNNVRVAAADERIGWRLEDLVRERPLLVVAAASTVGMALGGVLFTRLGRLGVVAAVGYIANGLWHREVGLNIEEVIAELSR